MSDDQKTYSADEHVAILADRVARETADLSAERDTLKTEKAELETKLDVEISAREAAELRATEAEGALTAFKAEVQEREEAAARKDERLSKVREAASHLDDKFFEDEGRVKRIVAMSEESFAGYIADLGATGRTPGKTTTDIPRETAMAGDQGGAGSQPAVAAGRGFLLRGFVAPSAPKEA
jgi:chromosome segregation ATPase